MIEPILAGGTLGDVPEDDWQYVIDLGLVTNAGLSGVSIANPIYRRFCRARWPVRRWLRSRH
jgi:hypothetical protein